MSGASLITGNPERILDAPCSMILSETFAERVFGDPDLTGRVLTVPSGQFYGKETDYTIMGVMRDFPQNSHMHPEFITTPPVLPVDELILPGKAEGRANISFNS